MREIFTLWGTYGIYSTELLFRIVMGPALKNQSRADPEPSSSLGPSQKFHPEPGPFSRFRARSLEK